MSGGQAEGERGDRDERTGGQGEQGTGMGDGEQGDI